MLGLEDDKLPLLAVALEAARLQAHLAGRQLAGFGALLEPQQNQVPGPDTGAAQLLPSHPQVTVSAPVSHVSGGVSLRRLVLQGPGSTGDAAVDGNAATAFLPVPRALPGHVAAQQPQRVHPQLPGHLQNHLGFRLPLVQHVPVQGLGPHIQHLAKGLVVQSPLPHNLAQPPAKALLLFHGRTSIVPLM